MATYQALKDLHRTSSPFQPLIPTSSLQPLAFVFLFASFILAFYFSTLKPSKLPLREVAVAGAASVFGALGIIFGFSAIGVNV